MASFVASGNACWAPNPVPERGVSYSLESDGRFLAYGAGYVVVLRDASELTRARVFVGHKKHVKSVAFSPDSKYLASGDEGGVLRVWDVASGEVKKEMPVLGGPVLDIAWGPQGKRIAVCGDCKGQTTRVFMWESGSPQGELAGSTKRVRSIAIRPEAPVFLAYGGDDFKVKMHQGPPFKFTKSYEHTNFVQRVRYSPDGKYLASASSDKSIVMVDPESCEEVFKLPTEHKGSVFNIAWSDDGKQLLSASGDKSVKLWDVPGKKCLGTIVLGKDVEDMQVACAFAGNQAVSLSLSGDINLLDFKAGKVAEVVQAHVGVVNNLAVDWSGNSPYVFAGSSEGPVYAYERSGHAVRLDGAKPGCNDGLTVHKGKLFSAGHDDVLRGADIGSGGLAFAGATSNMAGTPLGLSSAPADPGLAVTCTENSVSLARDGRIVDTKSLTGYTATCCAISEDGSEVAVGGNDKAAHIFTVSGDRLTATDIKLSGLQGAASVIAYSPAGPIAVGDKVKEITLWDRDSRECLIKNKWVFHSSAITALCFSPSGKHLASGGSDTQVIVWNPAKSLAKTKIPAAHALGVTSVAWGDDETVFSSGLDGCVRTWTPKLP